MKSTQRPRLLGTDLAGTPLIELCVGATSPRSLGRGISAHTPFGWREKGTAVSAAGFNGQLHEVATGAYHLGHGYRTYSPLLMRFHRPDNLSPFSSGGLNAYAYCAGDPINRRDSSGHSWSALRKALRSDKRAGLLQSLKMHGSDLGAHARDGFNFPNTFQVTRLKQVEVDIYTWETRINDRRMFGMELHGNANGVLAYDRAAGGMTHIEGVHRLLVEQGVNFNQYDSIILASCYGGSGGLKSSGARLSSLTGKPVTAFLEVVDSTRWRHAFPYSPPHALYPNFGPYGPYELTLDYFGRANVARFDIRRAL